MALPLETAATKVFLNKGMLEVKLKKAGLRLADKVGSLFLAHLATMYLLNLKKKTPTEK